MLRLLEDICSSRLLTPDVSKRHGRSSRNIVIGNSPTSVLCLVVPCSGSVGDSLWGMAWV